MELHNLMEDIVLKFLDEMLADRKDICKCDQCKSDIMCYTLNKIKPMYVISARGIIHTENENRFRFQNEIDVMTTLSEAIDVVSVQKRHDVGKNISILEGKKSDILDDKTGEGFYFNFPQLVGRVFDSADLSPVQDAEIKLSGETGKEDIKMFNDYWQNPVKIIKAMDGGYTFWAYPLKADKAGLQKDFQFSLTVSKEGYEPAAKFFLVRVVSQKGITQHISRDNIFSIEDIFISKGNRRGGR
jgi:competence protein ComFB